MFLSEKMRGVVILACEKHAGEIVGKIHNTKDGNWFVLPTASLFKTGYWPNVSACQSQEGGSAIVGFIESGALAQRLRDFDAANSDNGICPNCAIYEWDVSSLHTARTTRDPVCKHMISSSDSLSELYQGRLFFFCSMGCRDRFHQNPHQFVRSGD